MRFYDLLPMILRTHDAVANPPLLEELLDQFEIERNELESLVEKLRTINDCENVDQQYVPLLGVILGSRLYDGWSDDLERFTVCNTVAKHKKAGTYFSWVQHLNYRSASSHEITEVFKDVHATKGEFSTVADATHQIPSSKIVVSVTGATLTNVAAQTSGVLSPPDNSTTVHVSAHITGGLSYVAASSFIGKDFDDLLPAHVRPVHRYQGISHSETFPGSSDSIAVKTRANFSDMWGAGSDALVITETCTVGCQVACQSFAQLGCETTCQGGGGCQVSCELRCENQCQQSCEFVCQTNEQGQCQDFCQANCQTNCQTQCTSGCESSCTASCEFNQQTTDETYCATTCQHSCQSQCQSAAEAACATSCQASCEKCCEQTCEASGGCQTTCVTSCVSKCEATGGCQASCETYCQVQCTVKCQSACVTACTISCTTSCQKSCTHQCQVSCVTGCESQVQNACAIYCQANCQKSCTNSCQYGCQWSCTTGCQGKCESHCQGKCECECQSKCVMSCQSCCECICQTTCTTSCTAACTTGCETTSCQNACEASCVTSCEQCCEKSKEGPTACELSCEVCKQCVCEPRVLEIGPLDDTWDLSEHFDQPISKCCDHTWRLVNTQTTPNTIYASGAVSAKCFLEVDFSIDQFTADTRIFNHIGESPNKSADVQLQICCMNQLGIPICPADCVCTAALYESSQQLLWSLQAYYDIGAIPDTYCCNNVFRVRDAQGNVYLQGRVDEENKTLVSEFGSIHWDEEQKVMINPDPDNPVCLSLEFCCRLPGGISCLEWPATDPCAGGGVGGTTAVNCCGCTELPDQLTFTIAGLTPTVQCGDCSPLNATFVMQLNPGDCSYTAADPTGTSGPCGIDNTWSLTCDGATYFLTHLSGVSYVRPLAAFDCTGTNIFNFDMDNLQWCESWPATIQVDPV